MKKIFLSFLMMGLSVSLACAQAAYDIKEMTPAIKAALESRKARFEELKSFKARGIVGENNRGYVQALSADADVKGLVNAENKDRKVVYEAIVDQNGLDAGALATVEKVFARVQRDKAASGEKVQDENGNWN